MPWEPQGFPRASLNILRDAPIPEYAPRDHWAVAGIAGDALGPVAALGIPGDAWGSLITRGVLGISRYASVISRDGLGIFL